MPDLSELSNRQQEVLNYIRTFITKNSYPPSVRDIGVALRIPSTSTVFKELNNLEKKGFIRKDGSMARALTILDDDTAEPNPEDSAALIRNIVSLPLIGQVAAGTPILAEQNIEDNLPLPRQIVGDSASFLLNVRGDSMIEAGILNGDYVVVREQNTAYNGEIVVALIDNEATVKTFYKEADGIRLQPENSRMKPIYVRDNVTILGKVVALLRQI
ncbi:MAG: transcriptional repressor LexA [Actinomycetia bacterium]|nr:transcriptional repressor LexA [Actinomycetes bacterium]